MHSIKTAAHPSTDIEERLVRGGCCIQAQIVVRFITVGCWIFVFVGVCSTTYRIPSKVISFFKEQLDSIVHIKFSKSKIALVFESKPFFGQTQYPTIQYE